MSSVIQVDNLSKKYVIGHQTVRGYTTFRDAVSNAARRYTRAVGRIFTGERAKRRDREEFWALKEISFSVDQGERVGIIGRNGAGKSTLLKILSRITEPTSGRVRLRGRVASLLEVGTGFHQELSGRENIFLNGAILGMTKAEIKRKFDEIVAFAEIENFLDVPVKRYSSGMYVRLAFSVAAHLEPEILIVDEVLAVGDLQFQKKCLGKMEEVGAGGRTILFVSHNMAAIQQLTKRCLLLSDGCIGFLGDTANAIEEYLTICDIQESFSCTDLATDLEAFFVRSLVFERETLAKGFNQPVTFTLDLYLKKVFDNVTIRLGLTNSLGARIMTIEETIPQLPSGQARIVMTVADHRLPPGTYGVVFAIFVHGSRILSREGAISVLIPSDGIDNVTLIRRRDRLGVFLRPVVKISSIP